MGTLRYNNFHIYIYMSWKYIYHSCFNMSFACLNELIIIFFTDLCFLQSYIAEDKCDIRWECKKKCTENLWKFFHIHSNVNIFLPFLFDSFRYFDLLFMLDILLLLYCCCCCCRFCFYFPLLYINNMLAFLFQEEWKNKKKLFLEVLQETFPVRN